MAKLLPVEIVGTFLSHAPVNVQAMASALGVKIKVRPLADDVSGKIECDATGCTITVNGFHGRRRQRFTIAHEIAHFILHRSLIGDGIVDNGLYRSDQPSGVERQANQYAADILMPWQLVRERFAAGFRTPEALAEIFDVSPAVAKIRISELGLS